MESANLIFGKGSDDGMQGTPVVEQDHVVGGPVVWVDKLEQTSNREILVVSSLRGDGNGGKNANAPREK